MFSELVCSVCYSLTLTLHPLGVDQGAQQLDPNSLNRPISNRKDISVLYFYQVLQTIDTKIVDPDKTQRLT